MEGNPVLNDEEDGIFLEFGGIDFLKAFNIFFQGDTDEALSAQGVEDLDPAELGWLFYGECNQAGFSRVGLQQFFPCALR